MRLLFDVYVTFMGPIM